MGGRRVPDPRIDEGASLGVTAPRELVVRPSAESDAAESATYYAENADQVIADRFLLAVRRSIEAVIAAPERWPSVTATKRRYPVFLQDSSFHHLLYYRVTSTEVIVLAILHGSRAPSTWKPRR